MTVKNIAQFHGYTTEQLQALSTRHLVEIQESARGRIVSDDDEVTEEEVKFNANQDTLLAQLKEVLSTREDIVSTKQVKKKEKKVMKY